MAAVRKFQQLQYPGSTLQSDHLAGVVAQYEWTTPDTLDKVEAWYRQQFKLDKAFVGGVANVPWPSGVKATEARGQQQWAIFQDDARLKNDGTRHRDIRAGTTRAFYIHTPEHTVFTIINRGPQDRQTLVAVLVIQETKPRR